MLTKKAKLEQFDAIAAERDLLSLYLYDSTWCLNLDATEKHSERIDDELVLVVGALYRAGSPSGGYVVIKQTSGKGLCARTEYIRYLDNCKPMHNTYAHPECVVIDRLRVARQRLLDAKAA